MKHVEGDLGRTFTSPLASYIPISVDLCFILSVLTSSVAFKNLELDFFLMSQKSSCPYGIFVWIYPLLKFYRHQILCQVVGEGSLRALPMSSTTAFSDTCTCLKFIALKFIFLSCIFFFLPRLLFLEFHIYLVLTDFACHYLMICLLSMVSFSTFTCLFFSRGSLSSELE